MEDDDEDDVTGVETNSDPFWMKTCVICSLTLCVCLTPAEVEAESEAAAAASILEALNNHYDTEEIVDCPAEDEAESEATTETLNNDTDEVVEYIINKLCYDSTKLNFKLKSGIRLQGFQKKCLDYYHPHMCLPQSKRAYGGHNATFIYNIDYLWKDCRGTGQENLFSDSFQLHLVTFVSPED